MRKRILVWGLSNNLGGTESVISTYVKSLPDKQFDFLCYENPQNYNELFKENKNRFFLVPEKIKHPMENKHALNEFMQKNAYLYSSFWFNVTNVANIDLLKLAEKYAIPQRIIHIHNSKLPNVLLTKVFSKINRNKCKKFATDFWACSEEAGNFLFGNWSYRIIPNFINVNNVSFSSEKREFIRKQWRLEGSFVIGTIGRIAEEKNQQLLIRLMPDLLKQCSNVKLVLVGAGDKEKALKKLVRELTLEEKVVFAGAQNDVQGFLSAFDVFAFPSISEGLGIAGLEAQYNGLPCVFSANIPKTIDISSEVSRISLADKKQWCDALLSAKRVTNALNPEKASQYDLRNIERFSKDLFID